LKSRRIGRWQQHVNGVNPPPALRHWLTDPASLTAKLVARCNTFSVHLLHQRQRPCLADEFQAIGLARPVRVWEREVLLQCDGQAVVFAHTVVPCSNSAADWPLFSALGNRSLGSTLFSDPQVLRGPFQYARLQALHPLMLRARAATGGDCFGQALYVRRSLFRRHAGVMLVTEIFLPPIATLDREQHAALRIEAAASGSDLPASHGFSNDSARNILGAVFLTA
jgi:chorismate lyase